MQTLTQIQNDMRERLAHLQAAKDEYDMLCNALMVLGDETPGKSTTTRRRGRPPGVKNKPKPAAAKPAADVSA